MSDSDGAGQPKSALVFGARNLGRAVVETLLREGWQVAAAARSDATLQTGREAGALAVRADVTDASSVEAALREVAEPDLEDVYFPALTPAARAERAS